MTSRSTRLNRPLLCAAAVGVAGLLFAGCGSDIDTPAAQTATPPTSTPTTPATSPSAGQSSPSVTSTPSPSVEAAPSFTVANGKVQGPDRLTARIGDNLAFTVTSDVADEVHVHGYDETVNVTPGKPATVRLRTDIAGVFEIELEKAKLELTQLRVTG